MCSANKALISTVQQQQQKNKKADDVKRGISSLKSILFVSILHFGNVQLEKETAH